jgi:hypothetical protein
LSKSLVRAKPPARLILFAFILTLGPLWAQSGLSCDVAAGWNGVIRSGRYTPVIVSMENGGKKLACTVSVDVVSGNEFRHTIVTQTYAQAVSLPAHSRRRLSFALPIPNPSRPLVVRVDSGGRELFRGSVDVSDMIVTERIVVAVSSELSLDFLSDLLESTRVVYPHVENLPDRWSGYDGADAVLVHDTAFQNLRATQVSALTQWVFAGGILVVSGGPSALQLKAAGLEPLLPVEVTGIVPRSGIASLGRLFGGFSAPRGSMVLAASRLAAGSSALAEEDGIPIIATRHFGHGQVRFLAFDCAQAPMNAWPGNKAMWRMLAGGATARIRGGETPNPVDDPWLKASLGGGSYAFPRGSALLFFIILYLLAVYLIVIGGQGRMRPSVRAALLVAAALAASAAGWALFDRVLFRGGSLLVEASTAETVSGDGLALVRERVGLFSVGSGTVDLAVSRGGVAAGETLPPRDIVRGGRFRVEEGEGTRFSEIRLSRFDDRMISLEAVVELDVRMAVRKGPGSLLVSVSNGSPYALQGCFLSYFGALYPFGDVPGKSTVERVVKPFGNVDRGRSRAADSVLGDERRRALWGQVGSGFEKGSPLFFAWLDRSPLPLERPRSFRAVDDPLHLLVVESR